MALDDFERVVEDPPEGSFEWVEAQLIHAAQVYYDGGRILGTSSLAQFDMVRDEFTDRPEESTAPRRWSPGEISAAEQASGWLAYIHPTERRKVVKAGIAIKVYRNYAVWSRVRRKLRMRGSERTIRRMYRSGIEMIVRRLKAEKSRKIG